MMSSVPDIIFFFSNECGESCIGEQFQIFRNVDYVQVALNYLKIFRKVLLGRLSRCNFSIIFVYFVSILLIKLFGVNFDFLIHHFFEINIKTLITLVTFILLF